MSTPTYVRGILLEEGSGDRVADVTVLIRRNGERGRPELGRAVTGADGRFRIALESASARRGRMSIELRYRGQTIEPTEWSVTDLANVNLEDEIAICVPAIQVAEPPDDDAPENGPGPAEAVVYGRVRHTDGTPVAGVEVRPYSRTIAGGTALDLADTTDENGRYEVVFDVPGSPLHVYVEVRQSGAPGTLYATSTTTFSVGSQTRIDVELTDETFQRPSEYATVAAAVEAARNGTNFDTLNANHLKFLAGAADVPLRRVRAYVAAGVIDDALSGTDCRERVYGLLRRGWPDRLAKFLQRPVAAVSSALSAAADRNIVSRDAADAAEALVDVLAATKLARALNPNTGGAQFGLLSVLNLGANHDTVLTRWHQRTGSVAQFWESLRAEIGNDPVERVERGLRLHGPSASHPPLVERALAHIGDGNVDELGAWSREDWEAVLDESWSGGAAVGIPDSVTGDTEEERRETYISMLRDNVEELFPAVRFRADLEADGTADADLATYLTANPNLDIDADRIEGSDAPALAAKRAQRLARVGPTTGRWAAVGTLYADYSSALDIARRGKSRFVDTHSGSLGAAGSVEVYANARRVVSLATAGFGLMHPSLNASLPVLRATAGIEGFADYETVFGSTDGCICDPCLSISSPASYLVDLLAWVDQLEADDPPDAGDSLAERRRDLALVELSCDNTYRVLPYIDLVNEVLETAVLDSDPFGTSSAAVISQVRSTLEPAELLVTPEYVIYDDFVDANYLVGHTAYDVLDDAVCDRTLPYHRWNHQSRMFLGQLGVSRSRLLSVLAFPGSTTVETTDASIDALGLCNTDTVLIAHPTLPEAATRWGYLAGNPTWRSTLSVLRTFMDRAGLDYPGVLELLHSRVANPGVEIGADGLFLYAEDPCDTALTSLVYGNSASYVTPTASVFLRLDRVLRAGRALGLRPLETDRVLNAFGVTGSNVDTALDHSFVQTLGALRRLAERLDRPILSLVMWFGDLELYADRSDATVPNRPHYDRLFLDAATFPDVVRDAANWAFRLNTDRTELDLATASPAVLLADHAGEVAAAMSVASTEVDAAITWVGTPEMNVADVSAVVRRVDLARTLRIPVAQLQAILTASGATPFSTPAAALGFIERMRSLVSGSFSASHVLYLVCHDSDAAARVGISDARIQEDLGGIRDKLRALASTFDVSDEAVTNTRTEVQAYLVSLFGTVPGLGLLDLIDGTSLPGFLAADQATAWTALKANCEGNAVLRGMLDLRDFRAALIGKDGVHPELEDATERCGFVMRMLRWGVFRSAHRASLRTAATQRVSVALGRSLGFFDRMRDSRLLSLRDGLFLGAESASLADLLLTRRFIAPDNLGAEGDAYGDLTRTAISPPVDPTDPAVLPVAIDDAIDLYRVLHKVATLFSMLGLSQEDERWWFDLSWSPTLGAATPFDLLDVRQLEPWQTDIDVSDRWEGLLAARVLFAQRHRLAGTDPSFAAVLSAAASVGAGGLAAFAETIASRTGWDATDVSAVATAFGYTTASTNDLTNPTEFRRLLDVLDVARRLGVAAETIVGADGWFGHARGTQAYDAVRADADGALAAARSRYPTVDAWSVVARPLRDALRIRQRDALVAWLLHNPSLPYERVSDLFGALLIDVEMSPCQMTSRVKQACSAIQTYLQRNMMGFDVAALPMEDDDRDAWEWKKSYTTWEAAVQVFLYPENWIDPTLRPVGSALFAAAQAAITKGHLTSEVAEEAVEDYVRSLANVASLYPSTFVREPLFDAEGAAITDTEGKAAYTTHVVSRKKGSTSGYFYRQRKDGVWSPWEEIKVGVTGGHMILHADAGRVFLVWAEWGSDANTVESTAMEAHDKWLTVRLHWTERGTGGAWGPAECSDNRPLKYNANIADLCEILATKAPDDPPGRAEITATGDDLDTAIRGHWFMGLVDSSTSRTFRLYSQASTGGFSVILTCSLWRDYPIATCTINPDTGAGTWSWPDVVADPDMDGDYTGYSSLYPEFQGAEIAWCSDSWTGTESTPVLHVLALYDSRIGHSNYGATDADRGDLPTNWLLGDGVAGDTILTSRSADETFPDPATTFFWWADDRRAYYAHTDATSITSVDALSTATDLAEHPFVIERFYHPYAAAFAQTVAARGGLGLLFPPDTVDAGSRQGWSSPSLTDCDPTELVDTDYPDKKISFATSDAYAIYNWELFFHLPMLVATRLAAEQRFQEALDWLHCVFDPRNQNAHYEEPDRFWKVRPFLEDEETASVTDWVAFTGNDASLPASTRDAFNAQIVAWEADPFEPHLVAALRSGTYQKWVLMTYLDTLLAWGDQLFAKDTMESVNEATALYMLASDLLGERPTRLEGKKATTVYSYTTLPGGAPLEEIETAVTREAVVSAGATGAGAITVSLYGAGSYFSVPQNPKLLAYWDTVADRLFKIHNCMDLSGTVRSLALYEPPIDPMLLVRASALGVDIGTAIDASETVVPNHRFTVMVGRAQALAGSVRGFGSALLQALEKNDAESLALLRSTHEVAVFAAMEEARALSVTDALHAITALDKQAAAVTARRDYYGGLLEVPLSGGENSQLAQMHEAQELIKANAGLYALASVLAIVPEITIGLCPGATTGGSNLVNVIQGLGQTASAYAGVASGKAGMAGLEASWARRSQEWTFQKGQAHHELNQIAIQRLGAEVRLALAEKEVENVELQKANAETVDTWMRSKFTNTELYSWMTTKLSGLHLAAYDLAIATARKAEACYRHELGVKDSAFVQYAYWDSLKSGLLAGEALGHDLERMDAAYLDADVREHEMTKHIALSRLDPLALERLRVEGECYFVIPEASFDLDCPGHYFRRIQSVAVSLECVDGRDVTVNLQLTQHGGSIRRTTADTDTPTADGFASDLPSIVTSGSGQDAGLFQADLRDPRYLPFERRGAISGWHAKLTAGVVKQIKWKLITDLVVHLRYTARDGGTAFADARAALLTTSLEYLPFGYLTLPTDETVPTPLVTPGGAVFLLSAKRDDPDTLYAAQETSGATGISLEVTAAMLGTLSGRALSHVLIAAPGAPTTSGYTLGNWTSHATVTINTVDLEKFSPPGSSPSPAITSGVNTYVIDVGAAMAGVSDVLLILVLI